MKSFNLILVVFFISIGRFYLHAQRESDNIVEEPNTFNILQRISVLLNIECDSVIFLDSIKKENSICENCKSNLYKFSVLKKSNPYLGEMQVIANKDSLFVNFSDYILYSKANSISMFDFDAFRISANQQLRGEVKIPKKYFMFKNTTSGGWIKNTIGTVNDCWIGRNLYSNLFYCIMEDNGWSHNYFNNEETFISANSAKSKPIPEELKIYLCMTINAKPQTDGNYKNPFSLIRSRQILFNPMNYQVLSNKILCDYM
jgi:hypothetical protein